MSTATAYQTSQDVVRRINVSAPRDAIATAIYSTRNYSQFSFDPANRPIDTVKLERLYDAIAAKNLLADNPILVSLDFIIIDGQHRFKVAEALDVPIYYQFASDTTLEDIPGLASNRAGWKPTDYLHAFCQRGFAEYIALRDFMRRYDWMLPSTAIELCYYGDKVALHKAFNEGEYKCNNLDFANKVAQVLLDFRAVGFSCWSHRTFAYAVSNLVANAEYDHARMMKKLWRNSSALKPAVNSDDYFGMFNKIYNYGPGKSVDLQRLNTADPRYRADKKAEKAARAV